MEPKETIFTRTFGSSPYLKVLGFFITFDRFDYSKSQVANEVGISRITIESVWKDLFSRGIIVKSREIGRAKLYRLNSENPFVKTLQETNFRLASAYANAEQAQTSKTKALVRV